MACKLFGGIEQGAEPKSAVCSRPQNGEIQNGRHRRTKMYLCRPKYKKIDSISATGKVRRPTVESLTAGTDRQLEVEDRGLWQNYTPNR